MMPETTHPYVLLHIGGPNRTSAATGSAMRTTSSSRPSCPTCRSPRVMNEEPFGPIDLVNPVANLASALEEASRLDYGLTAYGFARSASSSAKLASGLQSGMVSINHYGLALPEVPFGGINDSGYGTEGSADTLEAYLNTKFISQMHA